MISINNEFRVEPADYQTDFAALRYVRETVFIIEQNVSEQEEWDDLDPYCEHVIARDNQDQPIGTARLTPEKKIGRMAVLKPWRGKGVGAALLRALIDRACAKGWSQLTLNAQVSALGFYANQGFEAFGEEFDEAGIRHRAMQLALAPIQPLSQRGPMPRPSATALIDIDDATSAIEASIELIRRARREILIYTRDLEVTLYGNNEVIEALRTFATGEKGARVSILIQEPAIAQRDAHPLLPLAQRLSSIFLFRTPIDPEDFQPAEAFLVNDNDGYIFRPLATRWEGTACQHGAARARQLQNQFEPRWERARPTAEFRALGI